MLLGYEDWQIDWLIDHILQHRGAVGGYPLCCPVTLAGLEWMRAAGFRALPPIEGRALMVAYKEWIDPLEADADAELRELLLENPDSVAVVRFHMDAQDAKEFINFKSPGPWQIGAERIAELNSRQRGLVAVVIRRDAIALS